MSTEHVMELIDLYALGALEPHEQAAVDSHLDTCAGCREALEKSKQVIALLAWAPDQQEPPPELYGRLMRRVDVQQQSMDPKITWLQRVRRELGTLFPPRLTLVLAPVAVVLALLLGWNLQLQRQASELSAQVGQYQQIAEILRAPQTRMAAFQPQSPVVGSAQGNLIVNAERSEVYVVLGGLPQLPDNKAYQLWLIADGTPVSGGILHTDGQGQVTLLARMPQPVASYQLAGITVEPAGGSLQPTDTPVLVSQL